MVRKASKTLIRNLLYKNVNYLQIKKQCAYCKDKKISLFNISFLNSFLDNMKGIQNRMKNKICYKHQRLIRKIIILAREMHLIPHIELRT